MTSTSSPHLNAAKQGDPEAIAALMNQSLQSKGICVKTTAANQCLTITAESETVPEQGALVDFIRQGITNLKPSSIERIVIQGKAAAQKRIAWRETVDLKPTVPTTGRKDVTSSISHVRSSFGGGRFSWIGSIREYANTILLSGIFLALLVNGWNANRPQTAIWEYMVESIDDGLFDITMQQAGAQGWELASARRAISSDLGGGSEGLYEVIFKRQITHSKARQNLKLAAGQLKDQELRARESFAQTYVGTINRAQQAYFLENRSFSPSFAALDLGLDLGNEDYVFSMSLKERNKAVVTATAKKDDLRSYTGAVVFSPSQTTTAIVCRSETPAQTAPEAPVFNGTALECASGSATPD